MTINPHYLDSIEDSKNSEDMCTITLSVKNHKACIDIHGTHETATERAIIIINALNEHERTKLVNINGTK